jgi:hypothetical protein
MSKSVVLLLVLVFLMASCVMIVNSVFSSVDVAEDSWVSKAAMHQARAGLGVVAVNGKIYAIGGTNASGTYPPDLFTGEFVGTNEEYDSETDTWTYKVPMPTPRDYFAIAAYENKIYCIGGAVGMHDWGLPGFSYVTSGVNEVYDTVTDTWETKTPLPDKWETNTPMPDGARKFQAHVIDGKIYVTDGSHMYVYDPTDDSWTSKTASFAPILYYSPMSAAVNNKILLTDGKNPIRIYDTETDNWSEGASPPMAIILGAAAATTGVTAPQKYYLLGIQAGLYPHSVNTQVYDPETDNWTTATPLDEDLINFGVAVVNDILYLIGGYETPSQDAWLHGSVVPSAMNEQYCPIGYGKIPPKINVVAPENTTYNTSSVSLVFTVDKPVNWTGYSLNGETNVTITGNTTLNELPNGTLTELPNGNYNITVYATDHFGNTAASNTIHFNIDAPDVPEPFPTAPVAAGITSAAVVCIGALIYFKKRRR